VIEMAATRDEIAEYIRRAAAQRNIDPSTALAVARSEGLNADPNEAWQSRVVQNGRRERSYGPYQLYIDGGLGNQFMKDTGLDPRNASTWRQQVDYSLDHAAKNGWGAWYGARNTGIGNFDGINGAKAAGVSAYNGPRGATASTRGTAPMQNFSMDEIYSDKDRKRDEWRKWLAGLGRLGQLGANEAVIDEVNARQRGARTAQAMMKMGRPDLAEMAMIDPKAAFVQSMQQPKDDRTALMKNAEWIMSRNPDLSFDEALQTARSGQTINVGGELTGEDKLRDQLMKGQGDTLNNVVEAGRISSKLIPDLQALSELAKVGPSGPLQGRVAEMFPEFNDAASARQAIIRRVAPQMRAEGSGSTSDVEYAGMVESLGRLTNSPEANVAIADMMIAKAELDQRRASIVQQYTMGKMSYQEMNSELENLNSVSIMPDSLKQLIRGAEEDGQAGNDDLTPEERQFLGLE